MASEVVATENSEVATEVEVMLKVATEDAEMANSEVATEAEVMPKVATEAAETVDSEVVTEVVTTKEDIEVDTTDLLETTMENPEQPSTLNKEPEVALVEEILALLEMNTHLKRGLQLP